MQSNQNTKRDEVHDLQLLHIFTQNLVRTHKSLNLIEELLLLQLLQQSQMKLGSFTARWSDIDRQARECYERNPDYPERLHAWSFESNATTFEADSLSANTFTMDFTA